MSFDVLDSNFVEELRKQREERGEIDPSQKKLNEKHQSFFEENKNNLDGFKAYFGDGFVVLKPLIFSVFLIEFFDIRSGTPLIFLDKCKEKDAIILKKTGFACPNYFLDWFVLDKNKRKKIENTRKNFVDRLNEAYDLFLADFFWPKIRDCFGESFGFKKDEATDESSFLDDFYNKLSTKLEVFIKNKVKEKKLNRNKITKQYLKEFKVERKIFFEKYKNCFLDKKNLPEMN